MNNNSKALKEVCKIIESNDSFVLTSHINPDGDGLGCEAALYYMLKDKGKEVRLINHSPAPSNLNFLDPGGLIFEEYSESVHKEIIENTDVIIVLDISVMERLGDVGPIIESSKAKLVCIDHHVSNDFKADVLLIDNTAAATGELIYEMMLEYGYKITPKVAEPLYVSILSDTGGFRFSNTNTNVLKICSNLLKTGISHHSIYRKIFESLTWKKAKLFSKLLDTISSEYGGQVGYTTITQKMMKETGTTYEDIDGFADYPRTIKDVIIAVLFVERHDGDIKMSFRSTGKIRVDGIASKFGGGGHKNASAAIIKNSNLNDAIADVLDEVNNYLNSL